jgi:hypothetical protein
LAIRSNARVVLVPFSNGGRSEQADGDSLSDPGPACVIEGSTAGRTAKPLRLPAALAGLKRPRAPEARGRHGRAAKAKSAHTRAASRMAVAGSRIMFGSRRWRGAEPDCPASRQRRADLGRFAGAGAGGNPNGSDGGDLAAGRAPGLAHFLPDPLRVEGPTGSLGDAGAE